MPIDKSAAIKAARDAKEIAKSKVAAARRELEQQKALRKNPPKQYIQMPEPTGDAEADSLADLNELQRGFRERAKNEEKRFALVTDSEYWACLCFQTRAQKDAFLQALGILDIGDKYIDGKEVAKRLGIALPEEEPPYNPNPRIDPTWAGFVD
jgi:hypothetical protein